MGECSNGGHLGRVVGTQVGGGCHRCRRGRGEAGSGGAAESARPTHCGLSPSTPVGSRYESTTPRATARGGGVRWWGEGVG